MQRRRRECAANCLGLGWSEGFSCEISHTDDKWDELIADISISHVEEDSPVVPGFDDDSRVDEEHAANCSGLGWFEGFSCELARPTDQDWDELVASIVVVPCTEGESKDVATIAGPSDSDVIDTRSEVSDFASDSGESDVVPPTPAAVVETSQYFEAYIKPPSSAKLDTSMVSMHPGKTYSSPPFYFHVLMYVLRFRRRLARRPFRSWMVRGILV